MSFAKRWVCHIIMNKYDLKGQWELKMMSYQNLSLNDDVFGETMPWRKPREKNSWGQRCFTWCRTISSPISRCFEGSRVGQIWGEQNSYVMILDCLLRMYMWKIWYIMSCVCNVTSILYLDEWYVFDSVSFNFDLDLCLGMSCSF